MVSKSIPRSDTDANHVEEMINLYRFGVMIAGRRLGTGIKYDLP